MEHDLQFLFLAEKYSPRNEGSSASIPLELVAKIYADGVAIRGDRPGVEFHDVCGGRLVFSDGLRNVYFGEPRSAPSRPGLVFTNGGQCRRYPSNRLGTWSDDRNHRADRSANLAARNRVVGEIQIRTSGVRGTAAFICSGFPAALQGSAVSGSRGSEAVTRVSEFIFRKPSCRGRREPKARHDGQVDIAGSLDRDASRPGLCIREDEYLAGWAHNRGSARHLRGSRGYASSSGVYSGARWTLDNSRGSDRRPETETFCNCATTRANCRVGPGHGAISDYSPRAHSSRRRTRNRFHRAAAVGNAVVHPVQRNCGSDGDTDGFERSLQRVSLRQT